MSSPQYSDEPIETPRLLTNTGEAESHKVCVLEAYEKNIERYNKLKRLISFLEKENFGSCKDTPEEIINEYHILQDQLGIES